MNSNANANKGPEIFFPITTSETGERPKSAASFELVGAKGVLAVASARDESA